MFNDIINDLLGNDNNLLLSLSKEKNGETYHLVKSKKRNNSCLYIEKKSMCKQINSNELNDCKLGCIPLKDMRLKVAELANQGEQICGVCVSTMYKNE